jgi:hypothetical protein
MNIQSVGPPPERHADRVVAEMLQHLSQMTADLLPNLTSAVEGSSDGSPRAQRKLEARLQRSGAIGTVLKPGKRGCYQIHFYSWTGWDPGKDAAISSDDRLPHKPWLACHVYRLHSAGRGRDEVRLLTQPMLLVSHHALSRLAQRHGAKTWRDLIGAAMEIWEAAMRLTDELGYERSLEAPPAGWRTRIEGGGVVVLKRHERLEALVAATII